MNAAAAARAARCGQAVVEDRSDEAQKLAAAGHRRESSARGRPTVKIAARGDVFRRMIQREGSG